MKLVKTLFGTALAVTIIFASDKALAFPLILKNISGKLTTTAYYGTNAETTASEYTVERFNLKDVMFLITNTVKSISPDITLPEKVSLAVDLYDTNFPVYGPSRNDVYLTNDTGFYFSLSASNLASFSINSIVTKFKENSNGASSEKDVVLANLTIYFIHDQNGKFYEIGIAGTGELNMSLNKNSTAAMDLLVNGEGAGESHSSAAGICNGKFTFEGVGVPPPDGFPFSVYWHLHNHLLIPVSPAPFPSPIPPIDMAYIPGGFFTMGDTLDGESDAIPTNIYVSAFYMDINLVSYRQWQSVYNWATTNGYGFDDAGAGQAANYPVQTVNWYDAVKWCNARSQQAGLTPVYYTNARLTEVYTNGDTDGVVQDFLANGYRLPTEAEWEKGRGAD